MAFERRIDVYPFGLNYEVYVLPIGGALETNRKLNDFINEKWASKTEAELRNTWIPLVKKIIRFRDPFSEEISFRIDAGAMTYSQTNGILDAIKEEKPFAPSAINNLSLGVIPVTNDGYVMLSRRNPALDHAGGVWNFNGGYMSSLLIDKENCNDPKFINDERLFNITYQLRNRISRQEFWGLKDKDMDMSVWPIDKPNYPNPSSLTFGFYHSLEMELGFVVKFNKTRQELKEHIRGYKISEDLREHSEINYVALEDLDKLLLNQGDLLNENPREYESNDPRNLILLDDNIGALIGGSYSQIFKRDYDKVEMKSRFIEPLLEKGLEIRIMDEYPYEFPTYF